MQRICAEQGCLQRKNGPGRTTANSGGGWFVTRYASRKKWRLSGRLAAGNLAGNFHPRFPNKLILIGKSFEFESSPGHQIFVYLQTI